MAVYLAHINYISVNTSVSIEGDSSVGWGEVLANQDKAAASPKQYNIVIIVHVHFRIMRL